MARKTQADRPFYRLTMAQTRLNMAVKFPETIAGDELRDLIVEAHYAVNTLMDFRNIINGMVGFEEEPKDAARPYLDLDEADDAA